MISEVFVELIFSVGLFFMDINVDGKYHDGFNLRVDEG